MVKVTRLFGTNGIRGVAGKEIDSSLAFRVGSALGTLFPKQRVQIGRDGRLSSPMLLEGVAAGLLARGNDVDDRGSPRSPIASTTKNRSKKRSHRSSTNSKYNRTGSKEPTSRHSSMTSHSSTSASKPKCPKTQCEAQCTPTRSLRSGKSPKSPSEAN